MHSLREGQTIEVRWEITTRRSAKRVVWWGASIKRLTRTPGVGLTGELLYNRDHGFEPELSSVRFRDGQILFQNCGGRKSKPHEWRHTEVIPSSSKGEGQLPGTTPAACTARTDQEIDAGGSCLGCAALVTRVERLERAVFPGVIPDYVQHTTLNSGVAVPLGSLARHSEREAAQLSILRSKLGAQLDLPLASHVLTDRGPHRTVQELLQVQADCSLRDMERLACHARKLLPQEVSFVPSFVLGTRVRSQTSRFSMTFSCYSALCRFLGITCSADVMDSLVKVRKKGKKGQAKLPIATRVIGALCCHEEDSSRPLLLAVGHNLVQPTESNRTIPVLYRANTAWDHADKLYEHKLEGRQMLATEIIRECALDAERSESSTYSSTGPAIEGGLFSVTWSRVSPVRDNGTFQVADAAEVHGTLQITVPYVLFRGSHHGAEVEHAIRNEFIAKAMAT